MKKFLHVAEALLVHLVMFIFGSMNFDTASNIGGWLGRAIGPHLKVNKTARNNIKMAMPELSGERVEEILIGMWDNLGRVLTEFAHMKDMDAEKISKICTIEGQENLDELLKAKGCFLMTGHFGNWEMIPVITHIKNLPNHIVYRKANNPYVDKIISKVRSYHCHSSSAKGSVGARQIIKSLHEGKKVLMLVDQKQNSGIEVPFFGRPAMTASGIANMALKYDCKIFSMKIRRVDGSKFILTVYPALEITKTGDEQADILNAMTHINHILEGWIRENPEQWFWVHNRWPKNL